MTFRPKEPASSPKRRSASSKTRGGTVARRVISSRASPAPRDDFDDDVTEEAKEYAIERNMESERNKIRDENVQRKKDGLSTLRLPPKYKKERRRRVEEEADVDSSSEDSRPSADDVWRLLEYEGQRLLNFNPLPILAKLPQDEFSPADIIRHMELDPSKYSGLNSENRPDLECSPNQTAVSVPDDILDHGRVPRELIQKREETAQEGLKRTGEGKGDEKDENRAEDERDENEEDEEEDYGEDDVTVVPWKSNSSFEMKEERKPSNDLIEIIENEPEEEEAYSDEEFFEALTRSSTHTRQSQSLTQSLDSSLLEMTERPPFPCTETQRQIPSFVLDPDDEAITIPAPINRFLRDYQRSGVWFMYRKYKCGMGGILGDDMGLGKTVQVIAFLSAIMRKTGTGVDGGRRKNLIRSRRQTLPPLQWATALLVCPTSLIPNWARELDLWGYFEYQIWTTANSRSTMKSMQGGYLDLILISHDLAVKAADELKTLPFSVVIVDEAHRMKNPKGRLGLAVKKIPCRSCFALTGTLTQNRMDEMWSVLDFCQRGWVGTLKEWRDYVVNPINRGHRHDGKVKEVITAILRLGQVFANILPHFYLRRDKRLIAHELPQKRDLVVMCPLGAHQAAVYRRIIGSDDVKFILSAKNPCECGSKRQRSECCHQFNSVGDRVREAILKMFDALGRVANHMALLYHNSTDPPQVQEVNRRVFQFCTGEAYDPARQNAVEATFDPNNCGKWNLLKNMLLEWRAKPEENNRVLLFSNSVRLLKYIEDFINMSDELGSFDFSVFSGEVDKADRMEMVDRFQDPSSDHFLMLVSTMAGGVGLNLTAANKVIIFDPNWNPANDLQAMDRAFRFGQKRPVDVYRFISQGTIEELMYERQIYKQQRARQINDGTFERRTHKGFEGASTEADKGELFGVHNIFRYNPEGYIKSNLERVQNAEEQLRHDFIEEQYESDTENEEDEDDECKQMRRRRMDRVKKRAAVDVNSLMDDILLDDVAAEPARAEDNILDRLGLNILDHNQAFRDSPEERVLYEKGLKLLLERPDLADMPANEIGKVRLPSEREAKRVKREEEHEEEPWLQRFGQKKQKTHASKKLVDEEP